MSTRDERDERGRDRAWAIHHHISTGAYGGWRCGSVVPQDTGRNWAWSNMTRARSNPRADRASEPTADLLAALRDATLSSTYVSMGSRRTASVHEFYRYPARFSP